MALNLEPDVVGVVVFRNDREIQTGNFVRRTGSTIQLSYKHNFNFLYNLIFIIEISVNFFN